MRVHSAAVIFFVIVLNVSPAYAAMTSTNFQINWDTFSEGGNESGSSTNFRTFDTIGGIESGSSTSANYTAISGYRSIEGIPTLNLVVRVQDLSVSIAYSAFNNNTKNVTIATTTGLSVGDYLAIVENRGLAQKVAVGRIQTIDGLVLTLDALGGANATLASSSSDADDYVYRLGTGTIAFGSFAADTAYTAVAMTSVLSSVTSGYTVYVQSDHSLQTVGGQSITPVSDGAVSVGSDEYGFTATGTRSTISGTDIAITNTQQALQSHTSVTTATPDRVAITYKIAITSASSPGSYSQNVFYTLTANF